MRPISRSCLVWITVNPGGSAGLRVMFPDVPQLRGRRITGVEAFDGRALANTPDQQPVIATANAITVAVTLKEQSSDRQESMPYATLEVANTFGIWKEFRPFVVDFQKSSIQFNAAPPGALVTVPFLFYYLENGEVE